TSPWPWNYLVDRSSRTFRLHGRGTTRAGLMPGAAFASGPAVNVSDGTFGQARSKAGAVEGDRSLVIEFSNDHDRRIGMRFRVLLAWRQSSHEIGMLRADCKHLSIWVPITDRPPPGPANAALSDLQSFGCSLRQPYPNLSSAS